MKPAPRTRILWTLGAFFPLLFCVAFASGQQRDEYGEIGQTVARITSLSGQVSFARGDDPNDWQPADLNVPMTLGDRVYTGSRSRLELQIHGGDVIRLGARSDLAALNLTDDTKQFSLRAGIASVRIRRLLDSETFEVDTPNAAITFERPGVYRVDVDDNGDTRIAVRSGSVTVAAGGGQIPLNAGEGMDLQGLDAPRYDIVRLPGLDAWDQWVQQRESRITSSRSYQYVSADVVGVDDLDEYGRWENVPQYGRVWTPTSAAVDWVPYRAGHWIWQDPWGWTWVSSEPWGWAPYHYGRWAYASSRWYWVPVASSVRYVDYSPALVGFVGSGPGWSASISVGGGGYVGWFPLGPRDSFSPWWGARTRAGSLSATNATYAYRNYVTVVPQNTFVSGGVVTNNSVRDRAVFSHVASAPVFRGPIPVVPTQGSLHVAVRSGAAAAPRPPAAIVDRMVVARAAPPPAPPTFQAKLATIRENHGAPVEPAAAARMSVENRGRPQATTEVRPAAAEAGHVTLVPRNPSEAGAAARRPEPVTAPRGREMATTAHPVSSSPVTTSAQPSRERIERQAPPAPLAQPTAAPLQERLRGRPENIPPPPPAATAVPPVQERLRGRPENIPPPPPAATAVPPVQERLRGRPENIPPPPPAATAVPPAQERLRGRPENIPPPPPAATAVPPAQERLRGRPDNPPPPPPAATAVPPAQERLRGRPDNPPPPPPAATAVPPAQERLRGRPDNPPPPPPAATAVPPSQERLRGRPDNPPPPPPAATAPPPERKPPQGEERRLRGPQPTPTKTDEQKKEEKDKKQ